MYQRQTGQKEIQKEKMKGERNSKSRNDVVRQLTVFWNVTPCSQVATNRRLFHDRKKDSNLQDQ